MTEAFPQKLHYMKDFFQLCTIDQMTAMTKSELEEMVTSAYSKADYQYLFQRATLEPAFFKLVWQVASEKPDKQSWRFLWILDHATEKSNTNLLPICSDLYKMVLATKNNSVIRQSMKLILRCPINEEHAGALLDRCISWMNNPKETISSQCMGLEFFFRCCELYPEMSSELLSHIEENLERHPSAGFKSRLKYVRKKLIDEANK
jgi:hypothetical protein